MTHIEFEKILMNILLNGDNEILKKLRKQYELSEVISREISNYGFFTMFKIPENMDLGISNFKFHIGDIDGKVNDIDYAIGFILFIENGYISMLEGYCNVMDEWPKDYSKIVLSRDNNIKDLKSDIRS